MTNRPSSSTDTDRFSFDPENAYTLASNYFTSDSIYSLEKDRIFNKTWQLVGHVSELSKIGDYMTCTIGDESLIVLRNSDNQLKAFYNVCPHRAHQLLEGTGNCRLIVCPYHAWTFQLDGQLRHARGSDDVPCFNSAEAGLVEVRLNTLVGFVFLNLDPDAAPLSEFTAGFEKQILDFSPGIGDLVLSHRIRYDLKANWKVAVDNYLECYHCAPTHPAFVDLVNMPSYRSVVYDWYSSHIGKLGKSENSAYCVAQSDKLDSEHFAGWWLWPNAMINILPGEKNLMVMRIVPDGPHRTIEYFDFYFASKEPTPEQWDSINYVHEYLQPEDIKLVESVQRGLSSKAYHQGRLIVRRDRSELSEHAIHHFHSLVFRSLS